VPELLMGIEKAYRSEDGDRVSKLGALLDEFLRWIEGFPGPYGVREALVVRKLPVGSRAIPFSQETEAHAARFREWFPEFLKSVDEALA
jgi:dihydrodipicolinate synthase/N-acetylneuraminate lyase